MRPSRHFAFLIAALASIGCGQGPSTEVAPRAPPVTLSSSADAPSKSGLEPLSGEAVDGGGRVNLFANLEAKAIVLIFVSTDCPVANHYAPTIEELYERYRSQPVGFWLIFPDPSEDREMIQKHLAAYKQQAPALRDPEHQLVAFCRATKTPEAVVFAPGRKLAYRGRIDDLFTDFGKRRQQPTRHDLRDAIDAVLAGRPVDPAVTPIIGCDIPRATP